MPLDGRRIFIVCAALAAIAATVCVCSALPLYCAAFFRRFYGYSNMRGRAMSAPAARLVLLGVLGNAVLALIKGTAGILGNSYALIADAIESTTDIFSSLLLYFGLRLADRPPDANIPTGTGGRNRLPPSSQSPSSSLRQASLPTKASSTSSPRIRCLRPLPSLCCSRWWW